MTDVTVGWETIDVDGQPMRMLVGDPVKPATPVVVVIHHGPGIDRFIEDRVRRLAEHGWLAIAPDLFHRLPAPSTSPPAFEEVMQRIGFLRDTEIVADLAATLDYIKGREDAIRWHVAVIGFCMGGRVTYLAAGALPTAWCAAGVFYGGNILVPWGDGPSPFARTSAIGCPMIGFFGNDDTNPSPADVDAIDAELTRCRVQHDFHRYDGAGHAFFNYARGPAYRAEATADGWKKVFAFYNKYLAG